MIASVIIEYNVKSLNKTFDYLVPNDLKEIIKVGHKVLVPFGLYEVEGFVLSLSDNKDNSFDYKEISKIIEPEFYLNKELLNLGLTMSKTTISNLIGCYQVMLPKALKASNKTRVNKKYDTYIILNSEIDLEKYMKDNKRKIKEIEIINKLLKEKEVLKKSIKSSCVSNLIKSNIIKEVFKEKNREVFFIKENKKSIVLTSNQIEVYNSIKSEKDNRNILLYGVTGSGKTEIYVKLINDVVNDNKTVIMLVPEISLTPQIVSRFKSEFGSNVAVLHSKLSEGEKYDEYRKIFRKECNIVIGARSAVFAPLENLGLIIIDECDSPSYKQDNNPKYNAIDIAMERCKTHGAKCLMGSATPLLEQYSRGLKGVFKLVKLETRVNNTLPLINLVDMNEEVKKRKFYISSVLENKIIDRLNKHEQVIILLNRRGYSTLISCSSCGYTYKCPNCDISLIYHKSSENLKCHYCGYSTKFSEICPKCKEQSLNNLGLGTEKLEMYIKKAFPFSKVLRMDTDTTSTKGSHEKIIEQFLSGEYDILIGTQMVSKGLNFPKVTLVGIINADASLNIPDFRSGERTYSLLTQTSGRSGRNDLPGEVVIQTFNVDNYVLNCVKRYDYISFYNKEMNIRKDLKYPPYYYIAYIKISSEKYETARDESKKVKSYLDNKLSKNFIILGPSTASIVKLKNRYFFGIIIKYKQEENLYSVLKEINENFNNKINVDININPMNMI